MLYMFKTFVSLLYGHASYVMCCYDNILVNVTVYVIPG